MIKFLCWKLKLLTIICLILSDDVLSQSALLPAKSGLRIIHGKNVTPEEIIAYTKFADSVRWPIDIVRIDNHGREWGGRGPLIISTNSPIVVDSLGFVSLRLSKEAMQRLSSLISNLNTNIVRPAGGSHVFRVTFRKYSTIGQYYIVGSVESVVFFKALVGLLEESGSEEIVKTLYSYIWPSQLFHMETGKVHWDY